MSVKDMEQPAAAAEFSSLEREAPAPLDLPKCDECMLDKLLAHPPTATARGGARNYLAKPDQYVLPRNRV
jgi:hypothetical protein